MFYGEAFLPLNNYHTMVDKLIDFSLYEAEKFY